MVEVVYRRLGEQQALRFIHLNAVSVVRAAMMTLVELDVT